MDDSIVYRRLVRAMFDCMIHSSAGESGMFNLVVYLEKSIIYCRFLRDDVRYSPYLFPLLIVDVILLGGSLALGSYLNPTKDDRPQLFGRGNG